MRDDLAFLIVLALCGVVLVMMHREQRVKVERVPVGDHMVYPWGERKKASGE